MRPYSLQNAVKFAVPLFLIVLIGGGGLTTQAQGGLTVCASGCDFSSIQAAVDAVQGRVTIRIAPGEYEGPVLIAKSLNLVGAGPNRTAIVKGVIVAGRAEVLLRGVMITRGLHGLTARDAAVVTVRESAIAGNAANGIAAFGRAQVILANVTIAKNGISVVGQPVGGGIALRNQAQLSTFNTVITESGANGISLLDEASANLGVLTTISRSGINGVLLGGSSTATLEAIGVRESGCYGVAVGDNAEAEIIGARIAQNAHAGLKIGGTSAMLTGCSTQIDPSVSARARVRDTFISSNPIGVLIGDFSKENESAVVLLRTLLVEKSSMCGLLIDPEAPKDVTLEDMTFSQNAQDRC